MTNVESVDTVLQYLSYLQLLITEITGHKNTMKMTKGQVKFTIQMVGQRKKNSQIGKKIVRLVKLKYLCQIVRPVALVSTEEDIVRCCYSLFRQCFS